MKENDFHEHAKSVWITTKSKSFSNRTNHPADSQDLVQEKETIAAGVEQPGGSD